MKKKNEERNAKKKFEFPQESFFVSKKSFSKIFEFVENVEENIWIKLYHNKYFYENFNLNFSLQNKQLEQITTLH